MKTALLYGAISGLALVMGALVGLYFEIPKKIIALIMAFGSGVLISSLSIDLMSDAFEMTQNYIEVGIAFLAGAILFVAGDILIERRGGKYRKSVNVKKEIGNAVSESSSGSAIVLGTLLDGLPESLVMGASIAAGGSGGLVFVTAVFLSNFPEGISGTIAMKNAGIPPQKIIQTWLVMAMLTIVFTVIGYQFLGQSSVDFRAVAMAFASGAILAMLSDTMLPEAFREGGQYTGIWVSAGFLVAFLISQMN